MYKIFLLFLITLLASTNAAASVDQPNQDLTLSNEIDKIIEEKKDRELRLSQSGKYEPNGIAANDVIKLGLSPTWVAVSDNVDRERSGHKMIPVHCFGKNCK